VRIGLRPDSVRALAALHFGQYMLVKASVAGAIVANMPFKLGASFLLGGMKCHLREDNGVFSYTLN